VTVAPLLQVLATCVHAQRRISIFPGESVVVLGLGVTGLLHVQLAKLRGAYPLIGVTRSAEKLALANALGADLTIAADGSETSEVAAALPGGADLLIECVGTVDAFARAMEMVRTGGRILAYGTMTATSGELPFYELYHKEISIIGARSARVEDFPMAIDAVASGRVVLGSLVSGRFPIDDVDEAIRAAGAPGALKVFVDV
jgi:threonine dehydrogenase-like Zn-dependent dehydrogenase